MEDGFATWFSSPARLVSIFFCSIFFFGLIVAIFRLMGKRLTAQMNNFDWIITVAVGSLAASGILVTNVAVSDAAMGILVLAGCQWAATWAIVRNETVANVFKPEPRMLLRNGEFVHQALYRERVSEREVVAAIRRAGLRDQADVAWVILETNGKLSVAPKSADEPAKGEGLLRHVAGV